MLAIALHSLGTATCFSQPSSQPNNPLAYPTTFQIASAANGAYLLREDDSKVMFCHLDNNVGAPLLQSKCVAPFQLPTLHANGQITYRIAANDGNGDTMLKVISNMGDFYLCVGRTNGVICGAVTAVPPLLRQMALFGHGAMSDLSPLCAPQPTTAGRSVAHRPRWPGRPRRPSNLLRFCLAFGSFNAPRLFGSKPNRSPKLARCAR